MRWVGIWIALLCGGCLLAACSAAPSAGTGEVSQSPLEIQVSRVESAGTSTPASSSAVSGDPVAEARILDLLYARLAAVKDKDAAEYLAVYPAAYADRLQTTDKNLTEYKLGFVEDCKDFLTALGEDVTLSAEIVGRSELSEEALKNCRSDFKSNYSASANITGICRLRIQCRYTGSVSSRVNTDWYLAYAIDGVWYLSPEQQMF